MNAIDQHAGIRSEHHASADTLEGKYREEERALVVRPVITAEVARELEREFQEMSAAIITADDIQTAGVPRPFPKKSAFRKYGRVFGFSWEVVDWRIGHRHEPACSRVFFAKQGVAFPENEDCGCPTVYAMFMLRVTHDKTGRTGIGAGICSRRERAFAHQDHDIPMQAFTRGLSRGISDLMGLGQPVAGEPDDDAGPAAADALTPDQAAAYKGAWTAAAQERRDRARTALEQLGYAPGEFQKRGREHLPIVMAILEGRDEAP
jgi:hypothetical protein